MSKRKKLNDSLNYFSICIIISVLLVVMSLFCYAIFDKNAKKMIDNNMEYFTQQSFYLIEERLALIEKIMVEISSDKKITSFLDLDHTKTDVIERANAISGISDHRTGESYIRSIFIYNKEENYVISDSGYSSKLDMFLEYILEVQQGKREEMKQNLLEIADITVVKYDKIFKNSSFLVLAPMYDKSLSGRCVIGVIVEAHFLEDILERIKINSKSILLLTNDAGEIISASNEELAKSGAFASNKKNKVYLNSVNYNVFCSTSEKYRIKYYNFVPDDMMHTDYMPARSAMIIIIAISGILLITLVVLFSKRNYRILNAFITRMRSINPDIEGKEVEYIDAAIVGLHEEEKRINKLIKENYEILRESIIRQLINGSIINENKDEELMEYLGLDIEEGYKRTAILVFDNENSAKAYLNEKKEKILNESLSIIDSNVVTFILVDKNGCAENWEELVSAGGSGLIRAGVGKPYVKPDEIKVSYEEAKKALEFVSAQDNQLVFDYEKINKIVGDREKVKLDYKPIINNIEIGEGSVAAELFNQKIKELLEKWEYIKEDELKELLFNLGKSIRETFNLPEDVNICKDSEWSFISYYELKEMTEKYLVLVGDVLLKNDINIRQCNMVTEYIRSKNGFDFDLNQIAADLGINPSYLSRWFKEYMGETYTDYIKKLKIKEVKKLLIDTDLPLEEIALRVNYSSSSVLAKVFKRETGMTLKTFREIGKEE